ncbi:MAG: polyphosphate kinase, partial [Epsilonproteobacteria bacterium]|nr:polyphosphate kinase [Campylobacterota bacterium]
MSSPNLNDPSLYINRELSWLKFNSRVLYQATRKENPLLERLKFVAIYGTNLDEFYMIRVAGLKQLFSNGIVVTGEDHMTPLEQLKAIRDYLHNEKLEVEQIYKEIVEELKKENLFIITYNELNEDQKEEALNYFFKNIFPVIIPIAVDATHPFPHLNNLSFSLAVKLKDKDNPEDTKYGMVRIPRLLPRFIQLEDNIYIPIESLIEQNIDTIFPGYTLITSAAFRVTRNADIVIEEEEADDFMEIMEQGLRLRKKGAFVRLEIQRSADEELIQFLNSHLKIFRRDIYKYDIPLNLGALWQIVGNKKFSHLKTPPYTPKILPPLDSNESIFHILDSEEVILYHPYESFEPVTKLIQTAAKDPKVLSIRITLYRVGTNSPIIQALIDAANNGKQVTAMV